MAEYTKVFRNLACRLDWQEDIFISCFKDGLNDGLYNACVARGALATPHNWCVLVEVVEIDQAHNKYCTARSWKKSP